MSSYHEAEQGFRDFAAGHGFTLPDVLREGGESFQRFPVDGDKAGERAGWCKWKYRQHDGSAFGQVGDWRTGACHTWHWRGDGGGQQPRRTRQLSQQQAEERRRQQEWLQAHRAAVYAKALEGVRAEWRNALCAGETHPYCRAKGIFPRPYNSTPIRCGSRGELLVPACGFAEAQGWRLELRGLQRIYPDGSKRNAKDCPLEGLFYPFGMPAGAYARVLVLAEGWATAATVYEALGLDFAEPMQTLCCFGAGNLMTVAREVHAREPQRSILIAADDDAKGRSAALMAAREVGGWIALPRFPADCGRSAKDTDFNDLARLSPAGIVAVLDCIEDARHVSEMMEGAA